MGIYNKLITSGSIYSGLDGNTPKEKNLKESKLHYTYSINGYPLLRGYPNPSSLDMNGENPGKYIPFSIDEKKYPTPVRYVEKFNKRDK